MFTETQKSQIKKRLTDLPDLGHRDQGEKDKLIQQFDKICNLNDSEERTILEKAFQEELVQLENYITYLRGRLKI